MLIYPVYHSLTATSLNLVGVSYSYNNDENDKRYGFIAQEVEKQFPNLVKEDDEGKTPLYIAARYGHAECIHLLINAPNINEKKSDNEE